MNLHYTYLLILMASVAGPLALSFDKKVGFCKKWKYLFPAMIIPALFYIVWDIFFTVRGVWYFNEKYITGIKIAALPLEEVLFFILVPYCCIFIYECVRTYFPNIRNKKGSDIFLKTLAIALLIGAILFHAKYYSSWTFLFTSLFIIIVYVCRKYFETFDAISFLVSYVVILIPFLIVNGFLTAIPVVIYNDAENLGIRIYTIPFEDVFYGLLLTMMVVCLYERRLNRKA
ncbi:MAG: lycopene cyclase domain-containing protein [Bacteroidota bacterium]|nr:lycopene cyclase domain-containing protein [Bacteroidota bacterium]MDP4251250.1 lycopene cyclase domain-containing protein [Bacteroidota bacterium]